ncbi:aldehyde dehydrogenase family protein [Rhodobaculum claviforme]|uniref:Aldehyde dehydrogenase domain-containing protein n=1 Tax=Rhodobaculum claviforme TaxID=1549854 RepID=A0A934WJD2_9RHOB|nr:aldehyde dehydrogenase family protein [Rhodobaculum claviforme]MBK5927403.1 hypothetical protein [Rhodobaculum claviforme]
MLENLAEMLMTHHVGGSWRAPLSQRMRDVRGPDGRPLGRMVEGGAADVARAIAMAAACGLEGMDPAQRADLAARVLEEWHARRAALEAALRHGGGSDATDLPPLAPLAVSGPVAMLGTVAAAPGLMAAAVAGALRAGQPVVLKPAPRGPFTALALAEAVAAAGAPPGAFALLQGGGAHTGRALVSHPGLGAAVVLGKAPRAGLFGVRRLG